MGDEGEFWADVKPEMKRRSREKRAGNRDYSARMLASEGVPYEVRNGGAHLILLPVKCQRIDFWPGTGLWVTLDKKVRARGIGTLFSYIRAVSQP